MHEYNAKYFSLSLRTAILKFYIFHIRLMYVKNIIKNDD